MMPLKEKVEIIEKIDWELGVIELRVDNILQFHPYEGVTGVSLDQLKDMLVNLKEITDGIPRPYLSHNINMTEPLSTEAKVFVGKHCHEFATAMAITEQHAITRFIAHSIMYLYRPQIPMKLFKNKTLAYEWLKTQ
ncbi:MAG: hypothetical protein JKY54_13570 [Flavobacteriales bacterium]|nr:hypothetical protein [Flavobacteriales bacterium]